MPKWEYKMIYGYIIHLKGNKMEYTDLSQLWTKQPNSKEEPVWETVKRNGDEGWELVSVFPVASFTLGENAGYTSHIVFVFKRSKE